MATRKTRLWLLVGVAVIFGVTITLRAGPNDTPGDGQPRQGVAVPPAGALKGITVAEARARARLMHDIYEATLDAMHHHYFRRDRAVLPARAMEDVFSDIASRSNIKSAWISVNTKAMSVQHEPKTEFEKMAARAIAAGKGEFEMVEKGTYRRAGAIPLGSNCVSCHTGFFSKTPQTQRFAGLVISMPIGDQ